MALRRVQTNPSLGGRFLPFHQRKSWCGDGREGPQWLAVEALYEHPGNTERVEEAGI